MTEKRARVMMENARGEWVPAIPMPFFGLRKKCMECGAKFWTMNGYRAHFSLKHIVDPRA